jgi:DNA (cytosine-5)-methyltransferase 1
MTVLENKIPLKEQLALVNKCLDTREPLSDALSQRVLTYDSLRYIDYPEGDLCGSKVEYLDSLEKPIPTIPAVSFFSGAGGLNLGFGYAGFNNLASIEFNEIFRDTIRHNNPGKAVI